ncbi:hypothetical protein [Flavobacterium sp.]|uniref:hypothetical protein n=1 Tax=Flavobacterium sp. TaxID=239 RepID=UPI0025BE6DC6|nr:hypothetical protein [Flavobacterium sp.]
MKHSEIQNGINLIAKISARADYFTKKYSIYTYGFRFSIQLFSFSAKYEIIFCKLKFEGYFYFKKQLKLLLSISLTIILFLNLFSSVLVYTIFKINQNEIAKTLCVLREQKNNTCNGNCVLKAELKKQAENEQKHSTILKEKIEILYTITEIEYNFSFIKIEETTKISSFCKIAKTKPILFSVFHPPIA